jgi:hypothetical protein
MMVKELVILLHCGHKAVINGVINPFAGTWSCTEHGQQEADAALRVGGDAITPPEFVAILNRTPDNGKTQGTDHRAG